MWQVLKNHRTVATLSMVHTYCDDTVMLMGRLGCLQHVIKLNAAEAITPTGLVHAHRITEWRMQSQIRSINAALQRREDKRILKVIYIHIHIYIFIYLCLNTYTSKSFKNDKAHLMNCKESCYNTLNKHSTSESTKHRTEKTFIKYHCIRSRYNIQVNTWANNQSELHISFWFWFSNWGSSRVNVTRTWNI